MHRAHDLETPAGLTPLSFGLSQPKAYLELSTVYFLKSGFFDIAINWHILREAWGNVSQLPYASVYCSTLLRSIASHFSRFVTVMGPGQGHT